MDISLDRQASSASVIWFEKLSHDHQLSWRKLLKIIILNFILYIIQVYMYNNMKAMRKCDDEIYQLAKDQALVKKLKNKIFRPF